MNQRESVALLRQTLEQYVRELTEELLYWVEELNRLDASLEADSEMARDRAASERTLTPPS